MGYPGIGVLVGILCGNEETIEAIKSSLNIKILSVELVDNELIFHLANKKNLIMWDDGQSCCEYRYMVCDDDLTHFENSTLLDITLENAPDVETEYDVHEIQFLHVKTSRGSFTVSSHNKHNGYYGGFRIQAELKDVN